RLGLRRLVGGGRRRRVSAHEGRQQGVVLQQAKERRFLVGGQLTAPVIPAAVGALAGDQSQRHPLDQFAVFVLAQLVQEPDAAGQLVGLEQRRPLAADAGRDAGDLGIVGGHAARKQRQADQGGAAEKA